MAAQPVLHKKISVVIPCYNEAENIPELYARLSKTLERIVADYEIIFVDNKSIDASESILRKLAREDRRVSVLFFSRNFGHSQYGYSAGAEYATGDAVVWMEGDLQDPPEVIAEFVDRWQKGFDVVYGTRPQAVGSFLSRYARRAFYVLFRKLSYLDIPRDVGDFSLMDRKVIDIINAMPERSRFVRGLRAWAGFRHIGVEYTRSMRKGGVTSNPSLRRNIWWAKKFIFSFSYAPLDLISRIAFWISCATGLFIVGGSIASFLLVLPWGMFFLVAGVLILFTLQSIALAILAESVSIIFEEVKQRPKYIVQEVLNDHRLLQ